MRSPCEDWSVSLLRRRQGLGVFLGVTVVRVAGGRLIDQPLKRLALEPGLLGVLVGDGGAPERIAAQLAAVEIAVGVGDRHQPAGGAAPGLSLPVEPRHVAVVRRQALAALADQLARARDELALGITGDEALERLQRLPAGTLVLLRAGRAQEEVGGPVLEVGEPDAEGRVVRPRVRGMARDELLVL